MESKTDKKMLMKALSEMPLEWLLLVSEAAESIKSRRPSYVESGQLEPEVPLAQRA